MSTYSSSLEDGLYPFFLSARLCRRSFLTRSEHRLHPQRLPCKGNIATRIGSSTISCITKLKIILLGVVQRERELLISKLDSADMGPKHRWAETRLRYVIVHKIYLRIHVGILAFLWISARIFLVDTFSAVHPNHPVHNQAIHTRCHS